MPNKTQEYLNLAQQTAKELTRYWENWTDYLTTASRLYKYSYADQLMIYAQRPDATACASFDLWNNRMNRYVRYGSKGIALLDQSSSVPRLHYVFDVSDTGVRRNSRDPEVWQLGPDLVQPVSEMLAREYGVRHERITQQIADICGKLVDSYWDNNSGDILDIVDGSFLMDYDEAGQEFQFKSAAAISITYAVLERCGFEPEGHFDRDDFQAIFSFSTPAAVYALGTAVSECSRDVLRNIERTVKTTIRRRNVERSQYEYEQQERDLLDHRGLSAPEPDPAPAGENTGQVRATAPDLPDEASPGAVQLDASVGNSASAPVGGGANRREPDAADHAGVAETEPGSEQGAVSDGVGAAHEQPESTGRGTGDERADLQLSFFDAHIPTEAEQIESIDQAESEKSPSAFSLSQAEIENALRRGSNFENSKLRIWKIYQLQPDRKLRAKALANEYAPYGPGGSSHTYLDGSSGWLDHDSKGLTFEHYPDHQKVLLRWDRVEKYIDLMIQSNRYLSDKERRAIDFPLELNAASAAEYTALKAQHPDTLVGFEAGGNFMFYGEDAAKVAKVLNSALFTRETALGEVQVTGFPPSLWARKSKELWSAGNDVYLAGLNEDGTHHQTKHLHKEDYLPIGSIINMDGRKFRIDGVDFDKGKVSLQDMALADMRMPIFREEPLAVVRELYEQQDEALDAAPEKAVDYKVGDSVVVDLPTRTIEGTIGYVGETDVRIDTSAQGYSWSNEVLNRQQFEDGLRQDEPELSDEELDKLPISVEVNGEWQTFPDAAAADEALNAEPVPEAAGNFHITNDHLGEGGAKQKYARNIAAIRTLFQLEQEHRGATAEEQEMLSQYVGWGGLPDAFDPDKDNWAKEYIKKFYYSLILEKGFKPNSMEIVHTLLHPTFTMAVRDGLLRLNPTEGVMAEIKKSHCWEKTKRHALTVAEQRAFTNYIANSEEYRGWFPLFTVMLGTGCRIGEVLGLRWQDVDFKNRTISINHNLVYRVQEDGTCTNHVNSPKTKAGIRIIPMIDEVFDAFLEEYQYQKVIGFCTDEIDGYSGFVFCTGDGKVYLPNAINRTIRSICADYNKEEESKAKEENRDPVLLPKFSCHILRHTFCTRFCENETNLKVIQEIMGHADISTTMDVYAEAAQEKKKESMTSLQSALLVR